ncbi:muconolactone isomerase [Klebsiella pneumoniae]|nr:muconolactone isomerase [Klebsiella pneumoniae]
MFGPLLLKDDIVSVPLTFADGQVALPQTPGLGVELDEDNCIFIPASRSGEQEKKMLFKVEMTVNIPPGFPANEAEEIKQREKAYSQQLQREGNGDISGALPAFMPTSVFSMFKMPKNCININGIAAISLYGDKSGSPLSSSVINSR